MTSMTDDEHAQRLRACVTALNEAADQARNANLDVDFDFESELHIYNRPYREVYAKHITLTVSRRL